MVFDLCDAADLEPRLGEVLLVLGGEAGGGACRRKGRCFQEFVAVKNVDYMIN